MKAQRLNTPQQAHTPSTYILRGLFIMESDRPLDALNQSRGKRVILDLKNGKQYIGILRAFDIHINTVLEEAEEHENNQLKRKVGKVFIRGDTIVLINPQQ